MWNIVFQEIPDGGMRVRKIDVAAPDPVIAVFPAVRDQAGGLRVVNDHEFGVERKALGIFFVVGAEDIEVARLCMVGSAMQCVVEGLGNFEKILTSGHDFPANVDAEFFGKWNEAIQDFSHTSADGGGIDHYNRTASQS